MTVLRRAPRQVYRVYDEAEFLATQLAGSLIHPSRWGIELRAGRSSSLPRCWCSPSSWSRFLSIAQLGSSARRSRHRVRRFSSVGRESIERHHRLDHAGRAKWLQVGGLQDRGRGERIPAPARRIASGSACEAGGVAPERRARSADATCGAWLRSHRPPLSDPSSGSSREAPGDIARPRVTISTSSMWRLRLTRELPRYLLAITALAGLAASARFAVAPPRPLAVRRALAGAGSRRRGGNVRRALRTTLSQLELGGTAVLEQIAAAIPG